MDNILTICWEIIDRCNCECLYCYNNDKHRKLKISITQFVTGINNLLKIPNIKFRIILLGGEPTLHDQLFRFIDLIYEKINLRLDSVNVITNGTQSVDYYKKFQKYDNRFILKITCHLHYYSNAVKFKIQELANTTDINIYLIVPFNPEFRKKTKDIFKFVLLLQQQNKKITMYCRYVYDFLNNQEYFCKYHKVDELLCITINQLFEKYNNKNINKSHLEFKSSCNSDIDFFMIDTFGCVFICGFCKKIIIYKSIYIDFDFLEILKTKINCGCNKLAAKKFLEKINNTKNVI